MLRFAELGCRGYMSAVSSVSDGGFQWGSSGMDIGGGWDCVATVSGTMVEGDF